MNHHLDHRPDGHHHHAPAGADGTEPAGGLPLLLDLDAEVLAGTLEAVREDIASLADAPVRSILDLGAGTGTGTFGLLRRFAGSRAVAVDSSADMLDLLRVRADELGLADRVSTIQVDLDLGLDPVVVDPVDLAWASGSLHHLADADRTLAQVAGALRPGGLLAVVELTGYPRFLPDDTPAGAAEAEAHALLAADRAVDLPTMGSDWGPRLTRSGLVVELARDIVVDLVAPPGPVPGQYAVATLSRIRAAVADRLRDADREQLDRVLDGGPQDLRRRSDLRIATTRQLWIGRRPTTG